jgi:O-antigen/teichoic acid export membrane protein
VTLSSVIFATIFLLGLNFFSPKLLFIKENIIMSFVFIAFIVFSGLNLLIESVFMAYRNAKYILIKNSILSVLKIVIPFGLISLGAYGLFSSWMISLIVSFIISFFILVIKFEYKPKLIFYNSIINKIGKYSLGTYIAVFISTLPITILPIMITHYLGPEQTAFYFIPMAITALLFVIPLSTSNSLFAEGSHDEKNVKVYIKKSVKLTILLLIPGIILTILLGKYVLLLFGKNYSKEGFELLGVLAISSIFISINYICGTILSIKHFIKSQIVINSVKTIITLGASYLFISKGYGIINIGYAWIVGNLIGSLIYLALNFYLSKKSYTKG